VKRESELANGSEQGGEKLYKLFSLDNFMKKVMVLFICIVLASFVVAQGQGNGSENGITNAGIDEAGQSQGQQKISEGNYVGEGGQKIQVQEKVNNRIQLRVRNVSADCGLNLTQKQVQNETKLETKLSNGRNAEIKVMPDVASETALSRLRLKVCSEENNCVIELKEVGKGEEVKAAYEVKVQRQSRLFGIFGMKMRVHAQVNAEDGEVIRTGKPWWAFLASEPDEENEEEE